MNNTEKRLEKHTKEVIIEQIDICLSGQDPRYALGRYVEKLREEIIQQAIAEERERVVGYINDEEELLKVSKNGAEEVIMNLRTRISSLDKLTE